jgi:hypothetical protein
MATEGTEITEEKTKLQTSKSRRKKRHAKIILFRNWIWVLFFQAFSLWTLCPLWLIKLKKLFDPFYCLFNPLRILHQGETHMIITVFPEADPGRNGHLGHLQD